MSIAYVSPLPQAPVAGVIFKDLTDETETIALYQGIWLEAGGIARYCHRAAGAQAGNVACLRHRTAGGHRGDAQHS